MANVRVFGLARDLKLSSQEVIDRLKKLGVEVKTASSSVDEDTADKLRRIMKIDALTAKKKRVYGSEEDEDERDRLEREQQEKVAAERAAREAAAEEARVAAEERKSGRRRKVEPEKPADAGATVLTHAAGAPRLAPKSTMVRVEPLPEDEAEEPYEEPAAVEAAADDRARAAAGPARRCGCTRAAAAAPARSGAHDRDGGPTRRSRAPDRARRPRPPPASGPAGRAGGGESAPVPAPVAAAPQRRASWHGPRRRGRSGRSRRRGLPARTRRVRTRRARTRSPARPLPRSPYPVAGRPGMRWPVRRRPMRAPRRPVRRGPRAVRRRGPKRGTPVVVQREERPVYTGPLRKISLSEGVTVKELVRQDAGREVARHHEGAHLARDHGDGEPEPGAGARDRDLQGVRLRGRGPVVRGRAVQGRRGRVEAGGPGAARARDHGHGPRRPRQDVAARRDPPDGGRGGRGGRDHAAHRRLPRRRGHAPRRVPRHPRPRGLHADARARRQGDRHRGAGGGGRRRRHAADARGHGPRQGGRACRSSWP